MPKKGVVPNSVASAISKYYKDYIYVLGGTGPYANGLFYRYSLIDLKWENITNESYNGVVISLPGVVNKNYLFARYKTSKFNLTEIVFYVNLDDGQWNWQYFYPNFTYLRLGESYTQVSEKFYIFGGFYKNTFNELSVLEMTNSVYTISSLISSYVYPPLRCNHSLKQINNQLYLFGGLGEQGYLSDLWKFQMDTEIWVQLTPLDNIPSARHLFASDSYGDALLVWGGEDSTGLLSDMCIYNSISNTWTTVLSKSYTSPTPRKGACVVFNIPFVYLYGGETQNGISAELWKFNTGTSEYELISNSEIGIAYANCQLLENGFLVMFGLDANGKSVFSLNFYDFGQDVWTTQKSLDDNAGGTQGMALKVNDKLIYYGGRTDYLSAYKTLNIDYNGTNYHTLTDVNPYNMAFAIYKTRLYYSSGGSISIYRTLIPLVFDPVLAYIDLNNTFEGVSLECSPGTWLDGNECVDCSPGTYSENFYNSECTPCESGRYSDVTGATTKRQCYPCPETTFNPKSGQAYCLACYNTDICLIGSIEPDTSKMDISTLSKQPQGLLGADTQLINSILIYLMGLFAFLLLAISSWVRKQLKKIDIYDTVHNYTFNVPIISRKTHFGGVFTMIFIIGSIILIASALLQYHLNNLSEKKSLEPLVVLEQEIGKFYSELKITATFIKYSEKCETNKKCNEKIKISPVNFENITETLTFCEKTTEGNCIVTFYCQKCSISQGAYLALDLTEELSFAVGILIEVSMSSSIPESDSYIRTGFYADSGRILIGPQPSNFYFSVTPSLFKSEYNDFTVETGYHVSLESLPEKGSQYRPQDLILACDLRAIVYINTITSGLYTFRYKKQNIIIVVAGLFGSIAGLVGAVSFLLSFIEKRYVIRHNIMKRTKELKKIKKKYLIISGNLAGISETTDHAGFYSTYKRTMQTRRFNI